MGERGTPRVQVQLSDIDIPDPPPPVPGGRERRADGSEVARSRRRALRDPVLVDPLQAEDEEPRVAVFSVDATPIEAHVEAPPEPPDEGDEQAPGGVSRLLEGRFGPAVLGAALLVVFIIGMVVTRPH